MKILDLIFPQTIKCFVCGREVSVKGACDYCYTHLPWIKGNTCINCGGNVIGDGKVCEDCKKDKYYFLKNYSIFNYTGDLQKVVLSFKSGNKYLGYYLSDIINDYVKKNKIHFDLIIPMPIHKNRVKSRGFNQSEILVENLKDKYTIEKDVILRIKDTPHQTGLSRENRKINLKSAFEVIDKEKIKDKTILLVDDIYTTGSTLNECSKTLFKNGAKEIVCLCLARAVMHKLKME